MLLSLFRRIVPSGLLILSVVTPAAAHDLFLHPDRFPQPGDREVTVGAVLGFNFPAGSFAPREHLKLWARTDDGRTVKLETALDGVTKKAKCPLPGDGGCVVYADYTGYLTRTENGNEYLPKDRATGKKIERSVWVAQCGKLVLSQGKGSAPWREPVGLELEIVPQVDPSTLRAGELLPVQVLWKGKPFGSQPGRAVEIKAVYAGFQQDDDTWAFSGRLDREGRARLNLKQPGMWMAIVEHTVETPGSLKADRDMYLSTLVFQVTSPAAQTTSSGE